MMRAAVQEQPDEAFVGPLVEYRGPANNVELMDVATAVHVPAGIQQCLRDLDTATGGSPMQRVGVISRFAHIWMSALCQEPADGGGLRVLRCLVQRRPNLLHHRTILATRFLASL